MKTLQKAGMILVVFSFLAAHSFAQNAATAPAKETKTTTKENTCGKFVDANKNGICDNFESKGSKCCGANFVDKNNDGICDHRADCAKQQGKNCCGYGCKNRNGQGQGKGCCYGHGNGCNKVSR